MRCNNARRVPLYDIGGSNAATVSNQHILDYVCYKDGGRRTPRNLKLGKWIFDEPETGSDRTSTKPPAAVPRSSSRIGGFLSDSEDDIDVDGRMAFTAGRQHAIDNDKATQSTVIAAVRRVVCQVARQVVL